MNQFIELPVGNGGTLLVEAQEQESSSDLRLASHSRGDALVVRATQSVEDALESVQPALRKFMERFQDLGPEEITVQFGLAATAETGLVVARGGAQVNFAVSLLWRREQPRSTPLS